MKHKRYFYFTFLLILCPALITAQRSYHIGQNQGLEVKALADITKDKNGNMWLGTYDGLFVHEGARIRNLTGRKYKGELVERSEIHTVFQDSEGMIWVGSLNGIYKIDPDDFTIKRMIFRPLNKNINSLGGVYAIFEDWEKNMWISSDEGMYVYNESTEQLRRINNTNDGTGIPNHITSYKTGVNSKDGLWFHTENGMCLYNRNTLEFEHVHHNPRDLKIFKLKHNPGVGASSYVRKGTGNSFWFISNHRLLCKYNPDNGQLDTIPLPVLRDSWRCCQTLAIDTTQNLVWVGFRHGGLLQYDLNAGMFKLFLSGQRDRYISSNYIGALEFDDFGKLWVGSNNGIDVIEWAQNSVEQSVISNHPEFVQLKYQGGFISMMGNERLFIPFRNYGFIEKRLSDNSTIEHSGDNINTYPGLYIYSHQKTALYSNNSGLDILDTNGANNLPYNHSLDQLNHALKNYPGGVIWIHFVNEDDVFIKKENGLFLHYHRGTIMKEMNCYSFRRNVTLSDNNEHIWYINSDINLVKKNVHNYQEDTILLQEKARDLSFLFLNPRDLVDDGTSVWITSQNGLLIYHQEKDSLSWLSTKNGLSNPFTYALVLDKEKMVWVATLSGIDYYDAQNHRMVNAVRWPLESYMDAFGSGVSAPDGSLYFACGNKLIRLLPDKIKTRKFRPGKLLINLLEVNGEIQSASSRTGFNSKLKHNNHRIRIQFSYQDFENQELVEYFYKISGLNDEWYSDENKGEFTLNALPPGKFDIILRAQIKDRNIIEEMGAFSVVILPPFWETWWFRILVLLIALGVAYAIYRYRLRQILEILQVRNKIAADLHDDVASTVSSISYYSEFAKSKLNGQNPALYNVIDQMGENARESLDTLRDVIWSTQSKFDNFDSLKSKIKLFAEPYCRSGNIEFIWEESGFRNDTFLPPVVRRNIYLIVKEAIHNVVKYANCTVVSVSISSHQKKIYLRISDNGQGFDLENCQPGNGIENMRSRANEMGADFVITSAPAKGTIISLQVIIKSLSGAQ